MTEGSPRVKPVVVEFRGVYKIYGEGDTEVRALDGVDLTIDHGEFVAIMGSSGSGKSTCMNIVGCLDVPTRGQYSFRGVDVGTLDNDQLALLRRHYVGFVFQGFNLLARTTALENVELPLVYRRTASKERREKAMWALDAVGLSDRAHHTPSELSGGQQQRVAIARALVCDPSLLLADEPTGNLDSARKAEIMELLVRLNQERNITIAMVTHEPDMAVYVSRVVMFKDGKIVGDGQPKDVSYAGPLSHRPLSERRPS
ncbi:MAG: ABC transporter ATP-binding protein [Polyangiaceae bacterium]